MKKLTIEEMTSLKELSIEEMTSLVGGQITINGGTVSTGAASASLFNDFEISVTSGVVTE
jgi:natural product precursor